MIAGFRCFRATCCRKKEGVLRVISWVVALISRTQSAAADGSCSPTRCSSVPSLLFEKAYHFIECEQEYGKKCNKSSVVNVLVVWRRTSRSSTHRRTPEGLRPYATNWKIPDQKESSIPGPILQRFQPDAIKSLATLKDPGRNTICRSNHEKRQRRSTAFWETKPFEGSGPIKQRLGHRRRRGTS
jgi:hypothetical protein